MSDENIETGEGEGGENNQSEAQPWLTSVPEPLRGHEAFKGLAKQSDAFQKYVELHEKSKASVVIPGEKATDEERAAFYTKLGRPEAPDKYTVGKPEGLPEDMPYSPELETAFKQFAHKINLTNAQAKELFNWYNNDLALPAWEQDKATRESTAAAERAELDKAVNQLKDVWKGDEFKANVTLAERGFKQFCEGDEAAEKFFTETKINGLKLGDHPVFIKVFAAVGKAISPDSFNTERGGSSEVDLAKQWFPNSPNLHK